MYIKGLIDLIITKLSAEHTEAITWMYNAIIISTDVPENDSENLRGICNY